MGKKRNSGRMSLEKELAKLMDELNNQGINSIDELEAFMESLTGQSLDDLPERTDKKGRSQDLVYQAYEQPVAKGKKLIREALELDPDNAEAYNYLASIERDIDGAMAQYKKAIIAGEKTLGKKFFKKWKGYFWGMIETRPYMRAMEGIAECYYAKNQFDKVIEIYEEMLKLNPNDNQGVRYLLSTLLLRKADLNRFKSLIKNSGEEDNAFLNYNNALYHFIISGRSIKSDKKLLKAFRSNKYVIDYMLGIRQLPEEVPRQISPGDEREAIIYVLEAWEVWEQTENALDWIYEFKQKRLNMN